VSLCVYAVCVCVFVFAFVCVHIYVSAYVCVRVRACVSVCVHVCLKDCLFVCFGVFMCLPLRYYRGSFSLALTRDLYRGLSLYFSLSRVFCSESLSLSLRQTPSFSFSLALFLPLSNRDSLSSSESRFFVRSLALSHILFSSFSLNLPLFSIQVTFCLTSLVPPPPLILSSLGLQYSTSPPFEHTESRVVCHGDQGGEIERNHDVNMKKRSNLLTRRSLIQRFIYSVFTKDTLDEKGQVRDTSTNVTFNTQNSTKNSPVAAG